MQTVDVMEFDGTPDCSRRIQEWADGRIEIRTPDEKWHQQGDRLNIKGENDYPTSVAHPGDWVVRGPDGSLRVAR